ncbi:MAG: hypothetical protein R3298_12750, partial [Gammaproteobacteria bacterium]|nr:hypothetical protein [Gammaproteobacteria bacterium]
MTENGARIRYRRVVLLALLAWLAGALLFYRGVWVSGFDRVFGDPGDARFVMAILEHWFQVFQGQAAWRDPAFFHPVRGVLGYSDALFLFSPPYAFARAAGVDPYLAYQWTLVCISLIGYAAFFTLAVRVLRVAWPIAILGAWLAVFANNLYLVAGHPQLYAVHLVPAWLLLVSWAWAQRGRRPGVAMGGAVLAGLFLALLLYTSFYVGWFLGLALGLFALAWLLPCGGFLRLTPGHLRESAGLVAGLLLGFALGIVPFLLTYLPVLAQGFGRDAEVILTWTALPMNLVNVGAENLVWGALVERFPGSAARTVSTTEHSLVPTPALLLIALSGMVWLLARGGPRLDREQRRLLAAGSCTLVVLLLLPVRWDGVIPWRWILELVPGATAIRAVFRLELLAGLLASLVLVVCLDRWTSRGAGGRACRSRIAVAALLGGFLVAEQVNTLDVTRVDRRAGLELLKAGREIPDRCRSFVLGDVRPVATDHPIALAAAQQ